MRKKIKTNLDSYSLISCNGYSIKQAIYNIIDNALDAIDENGEVIVSTCYKNNSIYLTIEDNGIGMDEDTLVNIFNSYYSLKGEDGCGLGMVIVKKIIENHSGTIKIESKQKLGTKVQINLPLHVEDGALNYYIENLNKPQVRIT